MSAIDSVKIELSFVIGFAEVPISQILKLNLGSMIALDCRQEDPTLAYVGDLLVACGDVLLNGDKVSLRITEIINEVA